MQCIQYTYVSTLNSATMLCFSNKKKQLRTRCTFASLRGILYFGTVSHDPTPPDYVTQAVYTQMKV
jgi:hypothetical protein